MTIELDRVGDVAIEEVDLRSLSDADFEAMNTFLNVLRAESNPEDPPQPVEVYAAWIRNMPDYIVDRHFLGRRASGEIVASGEASWMKTEENKHVVNAGVSVRADNRRRGLAKALLGRVVEAADAVERTLLMGVSNDRVPAGEAFARRIGAEIALAQHINRLLISEVDRAMVERWIAEGPERAPGYSLVAVDGWYPDDLVEQIVDLGMVMNTAPRDDMDIEDWVWTVEQAHARDKALFAIGTERWYLAARHDATDRLVGWTEVSWEPSTPKTVWQWGTGVRPEHRGHALGKWLKAVMLKRIMDERPGVEDVRTGNADSNDAMLGINHALGFKPFHTHVTWQVKVDRVKDYLAGTNA